MVAWTNLGLLYLQHQDLELANQAFVRAQVLDSSHPLAWLGQALVANAHGDELKAENIFEHIAGLETPIVRLTAIVIMNLCGSLHGFLG